MKPLTNNHKCLFLSGLLIILGAWGTSPTIADPPPGHAANERRGHDKRGHDSNESDRGHHGNDNRRERGRSFDRRMPAPEAVREFHQIAREELGHLPSLNSRTNRLVEIQNERRNLQKQRQAIAADDKRKRDAKIEEFHSLLQRDLELAEESRKIAQQIVRQLPGIQSEIKTRRDTLDAELQTELAKDTTTTSTAARVIERRIGYIRYIDHKLKELEKRPERLDLLTRLTHAIPLDEFTRESLKNREPRTAEDHQEELERRQKHLQKELEQVENELQILKAGTKPSE